ncbi:MAG: 30S ribosomal protein S6 [Chloroflexi bacterium]|nr:30S ribosomal protein S6 [Chloroflexota bacterium]
MGKLRSYELYVVLRPELDEEAIQAFTDHLTQLVTDHQGSVASIQVKNVRKLAYAIEKTLEGRDIILQLRLPPGPTKEIERLLQLNETVLRYLTTRIPDLPEPEEEETTSDDSSPAKEIEEVVEEEPTSPDAPEAAIETEAVDSALEEPEEEEIQQ